jgi:hypothetical protein
VGRLTHLVKRRKMGEAGEGGGRMKVDPPPEMVEGGNADFPF